MGEITLHATLRRNRHPLRDAEKQVFFLSFPMVLEANHISENAKEFGARLGEYCEYQK